MYKEWVARRWRAFDQATINRELRSLPYEYFRQLRYAMFNYRIDSRSGYQVNSYGDGLMMVKDDSHGQGRCLFFSARIEDGEEVLTALLVCKKESEEAPRRVLEAALQRMRSLS